MPIYKPTELRLFLDRLGIYPKKGLSQNFLVDGNIIRKMTAVSGLSPEDTIVEIGPGPGSLTQALLESGARVVAVEKDAVLAEALERFQTPSHRLAIFCRDILTFPFDEEMPRFIEGELKAKVIANLPYHVTAPILTRLALLGRWFTSLTVMVQEEVARRLTAEPGTPAYSSLTVFLRFYTHPRYAFPVSRHCFYPVPTVDSAVVMFELRDPPLFGEEARTFFQLTRTAFEHRRKMLRGSLKSLFPSQSVERALEAIGQNPLARPEVLSLEQFLQLHDFLTRCNIKNE